jgi:hypothetical protein
MRITVAEGNRRPHDPVQATKFASEAGVVVGHEVQFLTHWKQYKGRGPTPSIAQDLWIG